MNKRISAHVDGLFANAPVTPRIAEVKEELLAGLNDKYNDLISEGHSEDDAFTTVVSGIGDISDLIGVITGRSPDGANSENSGKSLRSLFISVGVALYVLSLAAFLFMGLLMMETAGMIVMTCICAVATGLIVYGANIARVESNYCKANDTFVEEYKEAAAGNSRRAKMKRAASSSLWTLLVVFYLAISFATGRWDISWILFLVGACIQQIMVFTFSPAARRKAWHGILWTGTVVLYFIISFTFGAWVWSWMIFLGAAALEQIIRFVALWNQPDND